MLQNVLLKKIRNEVASQLNIQKKEIKKLHFDISEIEKKLIVLVNDVEKSNTPLSEHNSLNELLTGTLKDKINWEKLFKIDFICFFGDETKLEINVFCEINGNKEKILVNSII